MRIESNWDDCFIYLVVLEFPVAMLNKRRQSTRTFVMRDEWTESQFEGLLKQTFGQEVELLHFDAWEEGHLLKERREDQHEVN